MTPPAVSVLLPVYNARRYLAEAVRSVLNQTFQDFELVCVDDGSTDGSSAVLDRFARADRRVRVCRRPNTGIVGALNDGLAVCRAPLIARMDADDVALPDRLRQQVAYLAEHPDCVLVGSRVTLTDAKGLPIRPWVEELDHVAIDTAHLAQGWPVVHPTVMMRADAVRQVGGYREQYAWLEDADLFLRLAEVGRLANLPEPLLHYRQHFASVCHTRAVAQAALRQRLIEETLRRRGGTSPHTAEVATAGVAALAAPSPVPATRPIPKTAADYHRLWAWWALQSGHVRTARRHALQTLLRRPMRPHSWRLALCSLRGR